jgi:hypothetical protein
MKQNNAAGGNQADKHSPIQHFGAPVFHQPYNRLAESFPGWLLRQNIHFSVSRLERALS